MKINILIVLFCLIMSGCDSSQTNTQTNTLKPTPVPDRFNVLQSIYNTRDDGGSNHTVLSDSQTGNEYLSIRDNSSVCVAKIVTAPDFKYDSDRFEVLQSIYNTNDDSGANHTVLRDKSNGDEYLSLRNAKGIAIIKLQATGH